MHAIVLSRRDIREYDQIVSFYTFTEGKRELLARGVKKITSKNSAHLEPFSIVELSYVPGREVDRLTKVQPVEYFAELRQEWATSFVAASAVRLTDSLTQVCEPDKKLYASLRSWLHFLAARLPSIRSASSNRLPVSDSSPVWLSRPLRSDRPGQRSQILVTLLDAYVLALLARLGLAPILERCVVCEISFRDITQGILNPTGAYDYPYHHVPASRALAPAQNPPGIYFAGGGLICPACRLKKKAVHEEIAPALLAELSAIVLLQKGDWRLVADYPLADDTAKPLHELVYLYLLYHSEKELADWGWFFDA